MPRPVLPRERGYMDRVVEYLVGDGPSNRFALICRQCQSHNGMALREEFEYIGEPIFYVAPVPWLLAVAKKSLCCCVQQIYFLRLMLNKILHRFFTCCKRAGLSL